MKQIINTLIFIIWGIVAISQPGILDNNFGDGGKVITLAQEKTYDYCYASVLQDDGKIILAGSGGYEGVGAGFFLTRYNEDGSIDNSFGTNGRVVTAFATGNVDEIFALAIQPDGKILATGPALEGIDIAIVRYLTDGKPDSSFGTNGIVLTDLGNYEYVAAMSLQSDGKIVVAGNIEVDDKDVFFKSFTVRYNTDGSLDLNFGHDGAVITAFAEAIEIRCSIVQEDDKIIIAGIDNYNGSQKMLMIRYIPDGNLDPEFGISGIVKASFVSGYNTTNLNALALQADDKIVVAGRAGKQYDIYMSLVRFESNGELDMSFGDGGKVQADFERNGSEANSISIQSDGKIIISGAAYDYVGTNGVFALARYNDIGILDSSFGINGLQTTDLEGNSNSRSSILQKDGKIILAGNTYLTSPQGTFFAMARYNGGDAILPIVYNHFTATQAKEDIILNWQTATELNNKYFAIERSANATSFTAIAQVNSTATRTAGHDYLYTDRLPVTGTNYYRLKQTDADGKYTYSKVISINYLKPGSIQLFPNPAKDKLTIKGLNAALTSSIAVLDIHGKQVMQFTAKAAIYNFGINRLAAGTYMVRVKDNNGVAMQKFVKQ